MRGNNLKTPLVVVGQVRQNHARRKVRLGDPLRRRIRLGAWIGAENVESGSLFPLALCGDAGLAGFVNLLSLTVRSGGQPRTPYGSRLNCRLRHAGN